MADDKKAILLRIPPELWQELNLWAKDELRSLNAQIEFVLRESVRRRKKDPAASEAKAPRQSSEKNIDS
jgi:hypothetical protein